MDDLTALGGPTNPAACAEAKRKASLYRENAAKWLKYMRWVGAVTALVTAGLVIFAVAGADVARNVTALGTAVSGAGLALVIRERNNAVQRYDEAIKDIATYCPVRDVALFIADQ